MLDKQHTNAIIRTSFAKQPAIIWLVETGDFGAGTDSYVAVPELRIK